MLAYNILYVGFNHNFHVFVSFGRTQPKLALSSKEQLLGITDLINLDHVLYTKKLK